MSECVVRMERVPKNCDDGCWGSLSGECPWCDSIDGYKMVGNRPPNCPIIAVLPENHGRLVDADAFKENMNYVCNAGGWLEPVTSAVTEYVKKQIDAQTVIVPADTAERSET